MRFRAARCPYGGLHRELLHRRDAASTARPAPGARADGRGCAVGMRPSVARRLAPVLREQLGVITSAQLRRAGVDLELPRREGWLKLASGLWVVSQEPNDDQLLVALAQYAPAAVASGAIACRWHGLPYPPTDPGCSALAPHGATLLGGPLITVHQTRHLPAGQMVQGQRIAPVARAVADAARWTPSLQEARAVVLGALQRRRTTALALEAEQQAGALRNSARLARALDDWNRGAFSAPEAEAADALVALGRGAPAFLLNPELRLDGVLVGIPDGWIPSAGLGWEMDSLQNHGSSSDLDATLSRHERFTDAGLFLRHVTPVRFRADPRAWAADMAARARLRQGWSPPHGLVVVPRGPLLGSPGPAVARRAA